MNKVAIVTGAAKGIGKATACQLLLDGFDVAINDIDESALEQTRREIDENLPRGRRFWASICDVTKEEKVQDFVVEVEKRLGPTYLLVNNAGKGDHCPFTHLTREAWEHIMDVNLTSAFLCSKAVVPGMIERKSGKIVSVSSSCGLVGAPNCANYTVAKFGVVGLTHSLAAELAKHSITVNAVAPGVVETAFWDVVDPLLRRFQNISAEEFMKKVREEAIPLGRAATTEDVAGVISFLASPKADYITGICIPITGGSLLR